MAPAVSLKILQGPRPTLQDAFSGAVQQGPTAETILKKTIRGKKCTAHFRCANLAVSQEKSGTLQVLQGTQTKASSSCTS